MGSPVLTVSAINKSFAGVPVLENIDFEVAAGEVHAVVGENGAGKSVLMKILMGVHQPDSGEYVLEGRRVRFDSPAEAQRNRVSMVYQEFGLIRSMTVTENIFMDRLPTKWGITRWSLATREATRILERLGSDISPDAEVGDLKVAEQQEVEIARALSYDPLVLIMDEPSSSLSQVEIEHLHRLVRVLRAQGRAIIYISHKLEEVFALADRITVLRDGAVEGKYEAADLSPSALVAKMIGKPARFETAERRVHVGTGGDALALQNVCVLGLVEDVDLKVGAGTIVGVAGVMGAGKTELARAIVGALPAGAVTRGTIRVNGRSVDIKSMNPNRAREYGIGFVSEDRQADGIVDTQSVIFNVTLPALRRVATAFVLVRRSGRKLVQRIIDDVKLRPRDMDRAVRFLSGGNQQKVVIGKWFAARSKLLILDEPTRGIDVGAREEIYEVIRRHARTEGLGVLLLSSDLREILSASDRVLVMHRGRITGEFSPGDVSEHELLDMVLGGGRSEAASSVASASSVPVEIGSL